MRLFARGRIAALRRYMAGCADPIGSSACNRDDSAAVWYNPRDGPGNPRSEGLVPAHVPGALLRGAGLRESGTDHHADDPVADARMRNCKL
jgi:hypothetical protein